MKTLYSIYESLLDSDDDLMKHSEEQLTKYGMIDLAKRWRPDMHERHIKFNNGRIDMDSVLISPENPIIPDGIKLGEVNWFNIKETDKVWEQRDQLPIHCRTIFINHSNVKDVKLSCNFLHIENYSTIKNVEVTFPNVMGLRRNVCELNWPCVSNTKEFEELKLNLHDTKLDINLTDSNLANVLIKKVKRDINAWRNKNSGYNEDDLHAQIIQSVRNYFPLDNLDKNVYAIYFKTHDMSDYRVKPGGFYIYKCDDEWYVEQKMFII